VADINGNVPPVTGSLESTRHDATADDETTIEGLNNAEVEERVARGQTNASPERSSRTMAEILRANLLTRFNLILGILLAVILVVGKPQDALFGIVLVANALIGIVQEVRAKRTLDRLALLNEPRARVVRNSRVRDISVDDVVLDDLIEARPGDQVVADGIVRASDALEVDESLLTGESQPVTKRAGDAVQSGSFVAAGSGRYQATSVGDDAYARRVGAQARQFSLVRSELMDGINRFLRYVTWAIVPVAIITTVSQLHANDAVDQALSGTVAALVGMVPQGLVLLTSIAFAVAAVGLARQQVLVQQLPAVEGLARVDVVCFDKTGTLTDGTLTFDRLLTWEDDSSAGEALGAMAHSADANETFVAIARQFPEVSGWVARRRVAFSSSRKWSGVEFVDHGTWVLGAPEIVIGSESPGATEAARLAAEGYRVVAAARSHSHLEGERIPSDLKLAALVVLAERLRPEAAETITYFRDQGVALKVLSGDSPLTVGAVATRVGVPGAEAPVDAREAPSDLIALGALLDKRSVFGRVRPDQKRSMVEALQARGHTVAMTGDGINDVLALKLADIGIGMGSGAQATRAVAEIVLLDDRFDQVPTIVAEGRRVTANIERVANVFLTKTVWATALALAAGALLLPYPFLPRHLTIIDTLTIGIPCFFLALAPNRRRFATGFVGRVLRFAIPAGLFIATATFATFVTAHRHGLTLDQQRTSATIVTLALSLYVVVLVALPLTWRRVLLIVALAAGFVALFPLAVVRRFYDLQLPHGVLAVSVACIVGGVATLTLVWALVHRRARPADEVPEHRLGT
jgi:cation-transporting P-type ATPase E